MFDPSTRADSRLGRLRSAAIALGMMPAVALVVLGALRGAPDQPSPDVAGRRQSPDLVLSADVAGPAAPGAWARFTWTARNVGGATAARSALTVSWPSALVAQSASGGADALPGGSGLAWDLGDLAAGAERILTATLIVPASQPIPSSLLVEGHVLSDGEGGGGEDNHADRALLVRSSDLRLGVSGPLIGVAPGEAITHTVQVFNVGQGSAEGLRLDILPGAGLTVLRDNADAAGLRRESVDRGLRFSRRAVPGPWTGTIALVSRVPLTATSGMRLVAPLRTTLSSMSVDADLANNNDVAATLAVVQPDLRMTLTGPPELRPDDGAEFVLDYDNVGTGVARGVVMTATLPVGLRFVSASPPGRRVSDQLWTWGRSRLAAGDSDTVRVQVRLDGSLPAGDRPRLVAALSGAAIDMAPADNQTFAESLIVAGPPARVALTASPTTVPVDDGRSVLTARVSDAFGNAVADGTVLSLTGEGGAVLPASALTVGGVVSATFRAGHLPGAAMVSARAGAAAGQVALTLAPADVSLTGKVQLAKDTTEAQPGDPLTYVLTASNRGLAAARDAVAVIVLEQRLEPLAALSDGVPLEALPAVPPGVLDPPPAGYRAMAWRVPDLPANTQRAISVTVAVDADPGLPWTGFDTVFFRAGLQSSTADANTTDQRHQQRVDIVAGDLYTGIELNSLVSSIRPGGLLVYQITLGNAGQGAVKQGTISATLPEGTGFESWEPTHGTPLHPQAATFVTGSRRLTWEFDEALARTSGLMLRLTVDSEAAPERLLQTAVALASAHYDVNPDNNNAVDSGAWLSGVNLVVRPSGPATAMPEGELVWRIELQNLAQRDNAANVVVKAVPPQGFPVLEAMPGGSVLADGSVRWVVDGAMGPGASRAFDLRTRVPSTVPAGTRVRLTIEASSSTRDSYAADNKRELELLVVPGPPSRLGITAATELPRACDGAPVLLTAAVRDAFGNAVADGTLLRWQTAAGALEPTSGATAAGIVTTTMRTPRQAGSLRVAATSEQAEGSIDLDIAPGSPHRIALAAAPSSLAVFGRTRLTGRLWDACDNPARDGERLDFWAARGAFLGGTGDDRAIEDGSAVVELEVGGEIGPLSVGVRHGDLSATAEIAVLALTPTPTTAPRRKVYLPRVNQQQR